MSLEHYYSRQTLLPEVGVNGQEKLRRARVLCVGAGGLGSPALLYLAAAGMGTIGICDGDIVDVSNLHRQPIYTAEDIGQSKAERAAERIKALNPMIEVASYPFHLNAENALYVFSMYDLVLDCCDNFRTKFLINDAAFFSRKPVVRASIYQFEGQIQTYVPERGDPCLRCQWREVPEEGCVGTCQQVGVLGPVPGHFGTLQAMEAIKFFLGMPILESGQILFTDLIHYKQNCIGSERAVQCPLCSKEPKIQQLVEKQVWEIEVSELGEAHQLVDIREEIEVKNEPLSERPFIHLPLSSFDLTKLNPQARYAIFCQRGKRSAVLVRQLREAGLQNVFSVVSGIESLR